MNWIGMLIGAAIGIAFGLVLRCPGNTCPLASNWWVMTVIGAIIGLTWKS